MRPVQDSPKLAVAVLVSTVFALSFGDALVRKMGLADEHQQSLWQIFFLRSSMASIVLVLLVMRFGSIRDLAPNKWVLLRSAMLVLMWFMYFAALLRMPLPVGAAAFYTLPLFILIFSALLTGDRVGWLGVVGIALGFIGVLAITNPGTTGLNVWLILPLGAAMLYALSMILTRTRCMGESALGMAAWLNITFVAAGAIGLVVLPDGPALNMWRSTWLPMTTSAWGITAVSALAIMLGGLGAAFAYQRAPGPVLGTFDFSYLAFAILWGWLMFDEQIDLRTMIGIIMIVTAGMLALYSGKPTSGRAGQSGT